MVGGRAAGSGIDGVVAGQGPGVARVTESMDSPAGPEQEREEEVSLSEVAEDSDGESSDGVTGITESAATHGTEQEERLLTSEAAYDSDGGGGVSQKASHMREGEGAATPEYVHPGQIDADNAGSAQQTKDEL